MGRKRFEILTPLQRENFNVALQSVSGNRLRSILTIAIIAIGIISLVGIQTAVEALSNQIAESFSKMGTTSFSIDREYRSEGAHKRIRNTSAVSYDNAIRFKEAFSTPAKISISTTALSLIIVKAGEKQTEPRVYVTAGDENYLYAHQFSVKEGRNLDKNDIEKASFVAVIGASVAKTLFGRNSPIGQVINVNGINYTIIGSTEPVGATFGGGFDNNVLIPISNGRSKFLGDDASFEITIMPDPETDYKNAIDNAEITFRAVRRLSPRDQDDFQIYTSTQMVEEFNRLKHTLTLVSLIIGLITILGAAVGLMNIMLVSVKERTREIGLRKTIGATARTIRQQFLMEAIVIGQIGGLTGIVLGIVAGNVTMAIIKVKAVIPWLWILIAIVVCLLVSIFSGYIPAKRAAELDPIESLRYE
ncbi:MAG: ABC transporter permease [Bacteroidales bacterium]|jgi:putative ABC transport system permease protein|nr:ABC transporter permease [Bacteroidales bacterium]MCI2121871.1 ABC transporter permease [Bacteroidales bacterium]MCI2145711.1 ABC transporter permease [Bacteroidales bacterium]